MSRYIDADYIKALMINDRLMQGNCEYELWIREVDRQVDSMPYSIDLADYVPKEFHDKTCEAMAKRHQKEIEDMVSVVRCSECKKSHIDGKTTHYLWCTEWGRSTDTFGYCERGEREGE